MFVGFCRVVLHLHGNNSLKGKRRVVRSVIDRTRAKFNAAVAEVGATNSLKQAVIGLAVIGNDASHVDSMLGNLGLFIERLNLAPVASRSTEVIPVGDDIGFQKEADMLEARFGDRDDDIDSAFDEEEW